VRKLPAIRFSVRAAALIALGVAVCGCTPPPEFRLNAVHQRTVELEFLDGEPMPAESLQQAGDILTALFGTPQAPTFPAFDTGGEPILDLENLKLAAGPVASDRSGVHSGLYREHCAHCHGISGDGSGPTAAFLNPYPRDFRLGKFKFKSTRMYRPPVDEDLRRVIERGIPGTAMPSFRLLEPEELDALVDYVKYLSIRGQVERALLEEIAQLDADEPLLAARDSVPEEEFGDQLSLVMDDVVAPVLEKWSDRAKNITPVPPVPQDFFEYRTRWSDLGQTLFYGKANCAQCHGDTGQGDGQTQNYDDWTNEWLKRAKVDENDPAEIRAFVQLGALPPRKLLPRNLEHRVFRGGSSPVDLYRRIADGIEGTSMPAASGLTEEEIWGLVMFVIELGYPERLEDHQH
jgi:mono/diheme cytochrome c family protein